MAGYLLAPVEGLETEGGQLCRHVAPSVFYGDGVPVPVYAYGAEMVHLESLHQGRLVGHCGKGKKQLPLGFEELGDAQVHAADMALFVPVAPLGQGCVEFLPAVHPRHGDEDGPAGVSHQPLDQTLLVSLADVAKTLA